MLVVELEQNVGAPVARIVFERDTPETRAAAERELSAYSYVKHFPQYSLTDTSALVSQGYWGLD